MKKQIRFYCSIFFILLASYCKAQYVTIPDANFASWLQASYGSCMNGNQLDTTCTTILQIGTLNVGGGSWTIADLTGIKYFKSLTTLYCSDNHLTSLPALPASLTYLDCSNNQLTSLPVLPASLNRLNCSNNQLTSLPVLPASLNYQLICSNNQLASLPVLPASLYYLQCDYNQLTSLPVLPALLNYFTCDHNQLTSLPVLPASLNFLSCDYNQLTSLPLLPSELYGLSCSNNQLTSLPVLPSPSTGMSLDCSSNQLMSLPVLPASLTYLGCNYNQLSCLPFLPNNLQQLNGSGNQITCLPNIPSNSAFTSDMGTIPVCVYGDNNQGCITYPYLTGLVFNDSNKNGLEDAGEQGLGNIKLQVQPFSYQITTDSNGFIKVQPSNYLTITDSNGVYKLYVDSLNTYKIQLYSSAYPYYTISPASQQVAFTYLGQKDSLAAFAMQPIGVINDLRVTLTALTPARPGKSVSYYITYENIGTATLSGTVQLSYDQQLVFQQATPAYVTSSGNTLSWNYSNLAPFQSATIIASFNVPQLINVGRLLNLSAVVNPISGDATPTNNTEVLAQTVVGLYDPNLKQVSPAADISPANVSAQDPFTYTVYFQNTGTDTAFTVIVKDTISTNFEIQEIETIASSKPCYFRMKGNAASWTFNNILLPDSTTNEPGSHGFVKYRIIPKNTLVLGDEITNTAHIFFDYNAPITTNTTLNKVAAVTTAVFEPSAQPSILLYPNPSSGMVHIASNANSAAAASIKIVDVDGRIVYTTNSIDLSVGLDINLSKQTKGIYMVQVIQDNSLTTRRLVME